MLRLSCLILNLILMVTSPLAAQPSSVRIRKAVFSDRQLFWPQLEGKAQEPDRTRGKVQGKAQANAQGIKSQAGPAGPSARIAVLPVHVKEYRESLPCDSCHRLSANGMEFFLENYLKDRMQDRFPKHPVELVAPNQPLLVSRLNLMVYLDSIALPWDRWLSEPGQEAIYRPHDRFTRSADRKRLDKLGGMLGAAYLLVPARVRVNVTPRSSVTHEGGLEWTFCLALWNVAAGGPEWALEYAERAEHMNLDESLEGRLDEGLGKAWDGLPSELTSLWDAEPK